MEITSEAHIFPGKLLGLLICEAIYTFDYFYLELLTTCGCKFIQEILKTEVDPQDSIQLNLRVTIHRFILVLKGGLKLVLKHRYILKFVMLVSIYRNSSNKYQSTKTVGTSTMKFFPFFFFFPNNSIKLT